MPDKLIIDGYNLIYARDDLKALMDEEPEATREKLISEIEEYCAREERSAEVVFDAARREGPQAREERSDYLLVTYTAGGQSADSYIEKLSYKIRSGTGESVLLVTGDYDQQRIAAGAGMLRMSSREFLIEMDQSKKEADERSGKRVGRPWRVSLERRLDGATKSALERFKKPQ